jgi:hypothetical protein
MRADAGDFIRAFDDEPGDALGVAVGAVIDDCEAFHCVFLYLVADLP